MPAWFFTGVTLPKPATVVTTRAGVILRMTLLAESATKTLPVTSTAGPPGLASSASSATASTGVATTASEAESVTMTTAMADQTLVRLGWDK